MGLEKTSLNSAYSRITQVKGLTNVSSATKVEGGGKRPNKCKSSKEPTTYPLLMMCKGYFSLFNEV